jgi:hypothetical protein
MLNIYAPNTRRERSNYWRKVILTIQGCNVKKGIIMGDFNTPLTDQEKFGGLALDLESKQDLANFINQLSFLDVDLPPDSFTWSNRRVGTDCIQVRLDRALISFDWLQSFSSKFSLLPRVGSDHSPISLVLAPLVVKRAFLFRFEKMWLSHPALPRLVSSWWDIQVSGTAMFRMIKKLQNVKDNIRIWNKEDFGHIFKEKNQAMSILSKI